jgi:Sap, sulfolipid-1-addressing protein
VFDVLVPMLPAAIAIALSPIAIIQLILVLFSERARTNGIVFIATLLGGMIALPAFGAFVVDVATDESGDGRSTAKGVVFVLLGVVLLALAWRNFRNRNDQSLPKALDAISKMGPLPVFLLALGVSFLNPKNTIVLLSAGTQAGASGASNGSIVAAIVVFALIATLPFTASVGYLLLGGERAASDLERCRDWLGRHNRLITAIVVGVLALVLLAQGLASF